jgi:hypothetical protein
MKAFRIKQWDLAHETHESRKIRRLSWVAVPNKHDGLGFSFLRAAVNRAELYCAYNLMLQLASKSPWGWRGWLARPGKVLTTQDMALMTGFPKEIFDAAVSFFQLPEIDWIEEAELPPLEPELPLQTDSKPGRTASTPGESAGTPGRNAGAAGEDAANLPTVQGGQGQNRTGGSGAPGSPGGIPEVAEILAFCRSTHGLTDASKRIPEDYGRSYLDKKNDAPSYWFSKNGQPIDWKNQIARYWGEDRELWEVKKVKNGAAKPGVDARDLESQLLTETDANKRREIRRKLQEIGGRA